MQVYSTRFFNFKARKESRVGTRLAVDRSTYLNLYCLAGRVTKNSQDCQSFSHNKYVIQEIKRKNKATTEYRATQTLVHLVELKGFLEIINFY